MLGVSTADVFIRISLHPNDNCWIAQFKASGILYEETEKWVIHSYKDRTIHIKIDNTLLECLCRILVGFNEKYEKCINLTLDQIRQLIDEDNFVELAKYKYVTLDDVKKYVENMPTEFLAKRDLFVSKKIYV
jgi:hypothetical protein